MKSNHNNISLVTHFSRVACLALLLFTFSCKKFVEVDPPVSSIVSSSAFSNNASAAAVVTGIYSNLMATGGFAGGPGSVALLTGLMGDELDNYSTAIYHGQFYTNAVAPTSTLFWSEIYRQIYTCNLSIERLQTSTGVTENLRQQLMGEAKLMRAFFYFYLVNLFGDVPLSVTSDYRINNALPRTAKATVYQQMTTDLEEARILLTPEYRSAAGAVATDRLRPNKYAAMALLARTWLYLQDWKKAEAMADSVISRNGTYILEADLTKVFQRSSREIIWQLQPTALNQILWEPQSFVIPAGSVPGPIAPTAISPRLKNTFESGDPRFTNWVGVSNVAATGTLPARSFYFPYKYKAFTPNIEGMVVFRLAEMYLIRAEARAQQGMLTGNNSAVADLNSIRARAAGTTAGVLPPITVTSKEDILAAIAHERQVELFTEWGNRWFDLKRTGLADAIMTIVTPQKGGTWNTDWQLLPIPQTEIIANPKLEQNNGYPK